MFVRFIYYALIYLKEIKHNKNNLRFTKFQHKIMC